MMSTFALMRALESSATRYDAWMNILSFGGLRRVHERVASHAQTSDVVLDLGTGTGGVALACARRGAQVLALDRNPEMLDAGRAKAQQAGLGARVRWLHRTVMEIEDAVTPGSVDVVTACLLLSELAADEQAHVLASAREALRNGGCLVVADEVVPEGPRARNWQRLRRWPAATLGRMLGHRPSAPIENLAQRLAEAGFDVVESAIVGTGIAIVSAKKCVA